MFHVTAHFPKWTNSSQHVWIWFGDGLHPMAAAYIQYGDDVPTILRMKQTDLNGEELMSLMSNSEATMSLYDHYGISPYTSNTHRLHDTLKGQHWITYEVLSEIQI